MRVCVCGVRGVCACQCVCVSVCVLVCLALQLLRVSAFLCRVRTAVSRWCVRVSKRLLFRFRVTGLRDRAACSRSHSIPLEVSLSRL